MRQWSLSPTIAMLCRTDKKKIASQHWTEKLQIYCSSSEVPYIAYVVCVFVTCVGMYYIYVYAVRSTYIICIQLYR